MKILLPPWHSEFFMLILSYKDLVVFWPCKLLPHIPCFQVLTWLHYLPSFMNLFNDPLIFLHELDLLVGFAFKSLILVKHCYMQFKICVTLKVLFALTLAQYKKYMCNIADCVQYLPNESWIQLCNAHQTIMLPMLMLKR